MTGRVSTKFGFEFTPIPTLVSYRLGAIKSFNSKSNISTPTFRLPSWNHPNFESASIPAKEYVYSEALQNNGYQTIFLGKWVS